MATREQDKWYALPVPDTLARLETSVETGLSDAQVAQRQTQFGKNELPAESEMPLWKLLLSQFTEVMVLVLIAAAIISVIMATPRTRSSSWPSCC